jgi:MFS family permease
LLGQLRSIILSRLAFLASALPMLRPGTALPASSAPYLSGPQLPPSALAVRQTGGTLRKSLSSSAMEGMMAEVVSACAGGAVLTGWAIHLGCNAFWIGMLGALPFFAQLIQLPAAWFSARTGQRRVAIAAVCASRQALLPLAALPFLNLSPSAKQELLLGVAAASAVLGVVGNNAWVSWMGELVPRRIQGRYFGQRTAACTLAGTAASLSAGLILDHARHQQATGHALAALAVIAAVAGAITTVLMAKQHDPWPAGHHHPRHLAAGLSPFLDSSARSVMAYQVGWNASVGIAASFFSLHMLQNLEMGFALVAAQGASVAAIRILVAPLWGRAIDRIGVRPVLVACSFGIVAIPILWVIPTRECLWPIAFDALLSGVLWSGHGLASFQLPLAVAPPAGRSFYLAAFATVGGLSFALASSAGGAIATALPAHFVLWGRPMVRLHALFLLSSLARMAAATLALRIREPGAGSVDELLRLTLNGAARVRVRVARRIVRPAASILRL